MFATLDPTSRRLRLPIEQEIIINDTVGFIRDLPETLVAAFRATLEEISDSDLLFTSLTLQTHRLCSKSNRLIKFCSIWNSTIFPVWLF